VRAAVDRMADAGAEVSELSMPHTAHAVSTYYVLAPAEASSNLARFDGVRYGLRVEGRDLRGMYGATREAGFGPEVKRRVLLGTFALSAGYAEAFYGRAQRARTLIARDFARAFERWTCSPRPRRRRRPSPSARAATTRSRCTSPTCARSPPRSRASPRCRSPRG
jgi:aspartyl-tRNA(Asn)/glutamyl-tRNA(Gln) amidotransferase subunit A